MWINLFSIYFGLFYVTIDLYDVTFESIGFGDFTVDSLSDSLFFQFDSWHIYNLTVLYVYKFKFDSWQFTEGCHMTSETMYDRCHFCILAVDTFTVCQYYFSDSHVSLSIYTSVYNSKFWQ